MYSIKKIDKLIDKIKLKIRKFITKRQYEKALTAISACARILYLINQKYSDDDLEEWLLEISDHYCTNSDITDSNSNECILFYDGFGLDNRGLAQIYLLALTKIGRVIYITKSKSKDAIPTISNIIKDHGEIIYIDENSYLKKINSLQNIIETIKPRSMFLYTLPDDVVATIVFNHYKSKICRYQINLTDHAFWLGRNAFDYCIEFRNYGASVSKKYRLIPSTKILQLPFYPIINEACEFQGYPFSVASPKTKIVFSGGALYKTFGDGNKYYEIVRYILNHNSDTVFWYAGSGNFSEIKKLSDEYPNRVYLTKERKDLFKVLQHCYFYLNTYPICGGLMFQYAAKAGKIPLTLKYDDTSDSFLIDQEKLGVEYDNEKEFYEFLDSILTNEEVVCSYEDRMKKSVISADVFEENLRQLLYHKKTEFEVQFYDINTDKLRMTYLQRFSFFDLCTVFRQKRFYKSILKVFPFRFVFSCFYCEFNKLFRKV